MLWFCCCCCCVASAVSNSVQPHRRKPARLPCPWDSPGKNIGVRGHFLLECMKVKSDSEVTQSFPTLSDPMDCSSPGSSVHGILQARVLEWGAIAFSKKCNRVKQLFITLPDSVDQEFGKSTAKAAYLCPMVSETPVGKTR